MMNWKRSSVIIRRSLKELSIGLGIYIVLALGMLGVLLSLRNTLKVVQSGFAVVLREPFSIPIIGVCLLTALFLGLQAGLSITREKGKGILETIFYHPIRHLEYILGKFLSHWGMYFLMMIFFLISVLLLAGITRLDFSSRLLFLPLFAALPAAAIISFGIFLSAINRSTRGVTFSYIGFFLLLIVISLARTILSPLIQENEMVNLIALRDGINLLDNVLEWVSPVSYLLNGIQAILRGDLLATSGYLGLSLIFTVAFISFSVLKLRKDGVLA